MLISAKTSLSECFNQVRSRTEQICSPLTIEDHVVQPIEDVSPPKWHLGHTTWFFETMILAKFKSDYKVFDSNYNYLFNSYYESVGARTVRTDRGNMTRPGVDKIYEYRQYVDRQMLILIEENNDSEVEALINLGLQHEQQHQELLVYDIKYILGKNPLFPAYKTQPRSTATTSRDLDWLNIDEGIYHIGFIGNGFSFDNEHGRHKVFLEDFAIADRLITNGEFLKFMESDGYTHFGHWLSEGWEWVKENNIKSPEYWHFIDGEWCQYNLVNGMQPINMNDPVSHISFFEADAFAKWAGCRLATEEEWEVACEKFGKIGDTSNFSDSHHFQPLAANDQNFQFYGDLWEWTASAYRPYPRYEAPPGAVGEYNGKFMVNQMVLRGGSCATPRDHIRPTYRNFFHPHLRWMFSGIRLAKNI